MKAIFKEVAIKWTAEEVKQRPESCLVFKERKTEKDTNNGNNNNSQQGFHELSARRFLNWWGGKKN